jgi:hypothetical protein
VHAIALCNLAEFTGGLMTDVSIPRRCAGFPKGMTVEYLKKAVGTMRGVATPAFPPREAAEGYDLPVDVVVRTRRAMRCSGAHRRCGCRRKRCAEFCRR